MTKTPKWNWTCIPVLCLFRGKNGNRLNVLRFYASRYECEDLFFASQFQQWNGNGIQARWKLLLGAKKCQKVSTAIEWRLLPPPLSLSETLVSLRFWGEVKVCHESGKITRISTKKESTCTNEAVCALYNEHLCQNRWNKAEALPWVFLKLSLRCFRCTLTLFNHPFTII